MVEDRNSLYAGLGMEPITIYGSWRANWMNAKLLICGISQVVMGQTHSSFSPGFLPSSLFQYGVWCTHLLSCWCWKFSSALLLMWFCFEKWVGVRLSATYLHIMDTSTYYIYIHFPTEPALSSAWLTMDMSLDYSLLLNISSSQFLYCLISKSYISSVSSPWPSGIGWNSTKWLILTAVPSSLISELLFHTLIGHGRWRSKQSQRVPRMPSCSLSSH